MGGYGAMCIPIAKQVLRWGYGARRHYGPHARARAGSMVLSAYARASRCAVLTSRMVLSAYARAMRFQY
eukprot:1584201-Rhodomonas_salina.5